jgi:hypothetical protein
MATSLQHFVGELLTFIEKREEQLLSWGFYNVRWTPAEIEDAFSAEARDTLRNEWADLIGEGWAFDSLIQEMRARNLVYLLPHSTDSYRTRFAEGVRLLGNLRQMFREGDWATGPRLVSDIKIHLAQRTYPRRNVPSAAVWEKLEGLCAPVNRQLQSNCFAALARDACGEAIEFAGFQSRALAHILASYGRRGFSGSVVCAGTGSGKTKAFYIPAFLGIAPELRDPPFVKVIAVYPRNVLLADQLREAIAEATKLQPILEAAGLRPIRFGALLGATPHREWFDALQPLSYHWERRASGHVIPYLKSPRDGCSDLLWRDADRTAGRTALYRESAADADVANGVLALTRGELIDSPPDVLFLSLEMLNRELGNRRWQHVFGLRREGFAPRLLLLDEAHSYQGIAGAQAAWVLRRWLHWGRFESLHVTGLSATLREAPAHLARLAALPANKVIEFRPAPDELESEGAEYNLAIKGDPAAGASLLATSIQASMLLTRLLTPRTSVPSPATDPLKPEELYSQKVFGFSDNLDSVNRWFSDMLDAEQRLGLARLRALPGAGVPPAQRMRRFLEGQVWELPIRLGYNLQQPLQVTRCSSQDRGTDANSDVIIATSSLEVGYDDPAVGAILHHKRPASVSSFIQRKGRAGRSRGTRPWTVVVLSDYGGDRWAFHAAEKLFLPEIDVLTLPLSNTYVLRVQAALFLIDWLGRKAHPGVGPYRFLSGPWSDAPCVEARNRARDILRGLLELGQTWEEFRRELRTFLRDSNTIAEEQVDGMLEDLAWHEPRPLLLEVVPTALRKLEANWTFAFPTGGTHREDEGANRPLPKFVPQATFTELDVGEAILHFEPWRQRPRESGSLPIGRLLAEICPGRVSKRFATSPGESGYWHGYSSRLVAGENVAAVATLFPQHAFVETVGEVMIFEPKAAHAVHRRDPFVDSSNARWVWQTVARFRGGGEALPVRGENPWRDVFSEAHAFLHSNGEWLELLRFAERARFELHQKQGVGFTGFLRLNNGEADKPQQEAAGFRLRADGIRFVVSASHLETRPALSMEMSERFRTDWFVYLIKTDVRLEHWLNSFQADWMAQISLGMLTATALRQGWTLQRAQEALIEKRPEAARKVLNLIFQLAGSNVHGAEEEARLQQTLLDFWSNDQICDVFNELECVLWEPLDAAFDAWVQKRYATTLGQALRSALAHMSSQVSEENLLLDVLHRDGGGYELLFSELSSGGLGQVETITREIQRQPRRLLDALEFELCHCERDAVAIGLYALLALVRQDAALRDAFEEAREAERIGGFSDVEHARSRFCDALESRGFSASRGFVVAVVTRLLRAGSSRETDEMFFRINRAWVRRTRRLGLGIPGRTFAYACARHERAGRLISATLTRISGGEAPSAPQLYAQIQQLLLERCADSCRDCLDQDGRYYDFAKPSRALARTWLALELESLQIDVHPTDWPELARQVLRANGKVRLVAAEALRGQVAERLVELVVAELDLPELRATVAVSRVERAAGVVAVVLYIPDFVHGQS